MTTNFPLTDDQTSLADFTPLSPPAPSHPARPVPVARRMVFSCAVLLLCIGLCLSLAAIGWTVLIVFI